MVVRINWIKNHLLSQWPTFKVLGIAYLLGKRKLKLLFHGPKWLRKIMHQIFASKLVTEGWAANWSFQTWRLKEVKMSTHDATKQQCWCRWLERCWWYPGPAVDLQMFRTAQWINVWFIYLHCVDSLWVPNSWSPIHLHRCCHVRAFQKVGY